MKLTLQKILYATLKNFELSERMRRDDFSFDVFDYLSEQLGYKHSSILRKMCEARSNGSNAAKLGYEDAIKIMIVTNDYRLLEFMKQTIIEQRQEKKQLNLFSQPQTEL